MIEGTVIIHVNISIGYQKESLKKITTYHNLIKQNQVVETLP